MATPSFQLLKQAQTLGVISSILFLNSSAEVYLTCNKLHLFKLYNLMNFDVCYICETTATNKIIT